MKRIHGIGAALSLSLLLSLAGCGHAPDGDSVGVAAEPVKQAEAKAKPTAPPPQKAAPAKVVPFRAVPGTTPPAAAAGEGKCDHCENCDGKGPGDEAEVESDKVVAIDPGASPSRGPANAPVTVIIFSDFQCPFCSKAEATVSELEAAYPGKLRFVFKNQPLPFHQHARLAAKAALAANEQGKFWEYHDALFAHQRDLDRSALEGYAEDLGLDLRRFRAALDDSRLDTVIEADVTDAHRLDVQGTPTFFVNGRIVRGAQPLAAFRARVDQALAER